MEACSALVLATTPLTALNHSLPAVYVNDADQAINKTHKALDAAVLARYGT